MPSSLTPTFVINNEAEEFSRFKSDRRYNPVFSYNRILDQRWLEHYPKVNDKLLLSAQEIIQKTISQFGSIEEVKKIEGEEIVSRSELEKKIDEYIDKNNIKKQLRISFSKKYTARTSVNVENSIPILKVRLPITYPSKILSSVLDHEIGTHVFRWLNEVRQPWYERHVSLGLDDHVETEEGLAILHSHLRYPIPYLWQPALYVIAVKKAQTCSFSEVFEHIGQYVTNFKDCWRMTVRAKRGLRDTSHLGGLRKDALYLRGAQKVGSWLRTNDFNSSTLYLGKLSISDCGRLKNSQELQLPRLIFDSNYSKKISMILKENNL